MGIFPFKSNRPIESENLQLTLISLENWALVTVKGIDSAKYLQGQFTLDLTTLNYNQHYLTAHCNPQGKMWSTIRLFYHADGMAFIERKSILDIQINELKKYAVFSKVEITHDDKHVLIGVAGIKARVALEKIFSILPDKNSPLVKQQNTTLLWFNLPKERFLLVTDLSIVNSLLQDKFFSNAKLHDSTQWLSLDIEAGYPIIDLENSARFIPQATNLEKLNAISFNKGCYSGQEVVARAKFRGSNKRSLYWLSGRSNLIPKANDMLEIQIGKSWRRTGIVLASCKLLSGTVWIQAVLHNNLHIVNTVIRIAGDDGGKLIINPLPYNIIKE